MLCFLCKELRGYDEHINGFNFFEFTEETEKLQKDMLCQNKQNINFAVIEKKNVSETFSRIAKNRNK